MTSAHHDESFQREVRKINKAYAIEPGMSRSQVIGLEKMRRSELQQLCMKAGRQWTGGFVE